MARTYDDEVDVRTAPRAGAPDGGRAGGGVGEQPAAFVWHGRLHVVRAVLGRWYERRAWWEQDPQRAEEVPALVGAGPSAPAGPRAVRAPSLDREVWQVEASAGRAAGSGVYELCREDPAVPGGWTLRRVDD